jgi:putative inorganic carbon (HCO3(-)) transporter
LTPIHPFFYLVPYIVLLYVRPHEYPGVELSFPVMAPFFALAMITALLAPRDPKMPPIGGLLVGLCIAVPLSVVFAGWAGGGVAAFTAFTPVAMLTYLVGKSVDTVAKLKVLLFVMLAVAVFLAVHGIDQAEHGIGWSGEVPIAGRIRYIGILGDPNDLASTMLFALPLAIYFATASRSMLILRVFGAVAIPALLWATYLTDSRGAVVSLITMICVFAVVQKRLGKGFLVAPVLLAGLVEFAPTRFKAATDSEEESSELRIEAWYVGLQMLQEHPLFGAGYGTFLDHHERTAHNSFVLAFAELGTVGYFFWFSLIVLSVVMLIRGATVPDPEPNTDARQAAVIRDLRALNRAVLYGTVALLTAAVFLSRTYIPILYLSMGIAVAAFTLARRVDERIEPIAMGQWTGRLVLLTLVSFIAFWIGVRVGLRLYA